MINPILRKDIKTTSRTFKFNLLLMVYIAIMSILSISSYSFMKNSVDFTVDAGLEWFIAFTLIEAGVFSLLAPALTASSIAGEREKQTLDILLTTTLRPRQIIVGKILTALATFTLLVVCSLPAFTPTMMFGIITMWQVIAIQLYILFCGAVIISLCVLVSSFTKSSRAANLGAYLAVFGWLVGIPIIVALITALTPIAESNIYMDVIKLVFISPGAGLAALLVSMLNMSGYGQNLFMIGKMPVWALALIIGAVVMVLSIWLAARNLDPNKNIKFKHKKKK